MINGPARVRLTLASSGVWTRQPHYKDSADRADRALGDLHARLWWFEGSDYSTIGPHAVLSLVIDRDENSLQDGPRTVLQAVKRTGGRRSLRWADDLIERALPLLRRCPTGCHAATVEVDDDLGVRPGGWIELDYSGRHVQGRLVDPLRCSADNTTSALLCLSSDVALMPDGTIISLETGRSS